MSLFKKREVTLLPPPEGLMGDWGRVEYYRVRTWYLDRDNQAQQHIDYEAMQTTYPKQLGAGDLNIATGEGQGLIIPRSRFLAIEWECIPEQEYLSVVFAGLS